MSLMFLPHFDVLCDLLLNRRSATWNLFVLCNKKIKIHGKNALLFQISPLWQTRKQHWRDLLSIKNEANWLVAMLSKELWLVQIQNSKNFKKTWIERCRHLCVCPLIDHRREPIRRRVVGSNPIWGSDFCNFFSRFLSLYFPCLSFFLCFFCFCIWFVYLFFYLDWHLLSTNMWLEYCFLFLGALGFITKTDEFAFYRYFITASGRNG